jgi:hypothetical protein
MHAQSDRLDPQLAASVSAWRPCSSERLTAHFDAEPLIEREACHMLLMVVTQGVPAGTGRSRSVTYVSPPTYRLMIDFKAINATRVNL